MGWGEVCSGRLKNEEKLDVPLDFKQDSELPPLYSALDPCFPTGTEVAVTSWMQLGLAALWCYTGLRSPQWEFQGIWCTVAPSQASSRPGFSSVLNKCLVLVSERGSRGAKEEETHSWYPKHL